MRKDERDQSFTALDEYFADASSTSAWRPPEPEVSEKMDAAVAAEPDGEGYNKVDERCLHKQELGGSPSLNEGEADMETATNNPQPNPQSYQTPGAAQNPAPPVYPQPQPQAWRSQNEQPSYAQSPVNGQVPPHMPQAASYGQPLPQQGVAGSEPPYPSQNYPQQPYAAMPQRMPVQAPPGPSAFALYFGGILNQLKAFFSGDPLNLLACTARTGQKLLWIFWAGVYLFIAPLFEYVTRRISPMAYGFGRGVGAGINAKIYFASLLAFLLMYGVNLALGFAANAIGKGRRPAMDVLNLVTATQIPITLFAFPIFLFCLLTTRIWLLFAIPTLALGELMTYVLYQREFGLAKQKAYNWLYIGFTAVRALLWLIVSFIGTLIL